MSIIWAIVLIIIIVILIVMYTACQVSSKGSREEELRNDELGLEDDSEQEDKHNPEDGTVI